MVRRTAVACISVCLALSVCIALLGRTPAPVYAEDLMAGIKAMPVAALDDVTAQDSKYRDFAVELFKLSHKSGNTLVSPLSVMCALAMTANGADGETLSQMESSLGMTVDEMNEYFYTYLTGLDRMGHGNSKLTLANSIWFNEGYDIEKSFLQTNATYYGAGALQRKFDRQLKNDINSWVSNKTDGMIKEFLDEINENGAMYLINVLMFDAEWSSPYYDFEVKNGIFTKEDGTKQSAELMHSIESEYITTDNAVGFIKNYHHGHYAFVALLPDEGVAVNDLVSSLSGEKVDDMLTNVKYGNVDATMPKFETEFSVNLLDALKEMGMTYAFDDCADFSRLCSSNGLYIDSVLHKTYIRVDENGARAGAATAVDIQDSASDGEAKIAVRLDRPFVYMIIDRQTNTPIFIGTMTDIK